MSSRAFVEENAYMRDCRLEEAFLIACEGIQSSVQWSDFSETLFTPTEHLTRILADIEWKGVDPEIAKRFKTEINFSINFCLACMRRLSFKVFPSQDFIPLSTIVKSTANNAILRCTMLKKVLTCPNINNFRGRVLFNHLMISLHTISKSSINCGTTLGFERLLDLFVEFMLPGDETIYKDFDGEPKPNSMKDARDLLASIVFHAHKIFNEDDTIASHNVLQSDAWDGGMFDNASATRRLSLSPDAADNRSSPARVPDRLKTMNDGVLTRDLERVTQSCRIGDDQHTRDPVVKAESSKAETSYHVEGTTGRIEDLPDVSAVRDMVHDVGYVSDTASAQSTQLGELDPRIAMQLLSSPASSLNVTRAQHGAGSQLPPPLNGHHNGHGHVPQAGGGTGLAPSSAGADCSVQPSDAPSTPTSAAAGIGPPLGPPVPPGPASDEAKRAVAGGCISECAASCAAPAVAEQPTRRAAEGHGKNCDTCGGHRAVGEAAPELAAGRNEGAGLLAGHSPAAAAETPPPRAFCSAAAARLLQHEARADARPAAVPALNLVPAVPSAPARDEGRSDGPTPSLAVGVPRSVARSDSSGAANKPWPERGSQPARRTVSRRDSDMGEPIPSGGCGLLRWLRPHAYKQTAQRLATFKELPQVLAPAPTGLLRLRLGLP
jgi:hypothetical protein